MKRTTVKNWIRCLTLVLALVLTLGCVEAPRAAAAGYSQNSWKSNLLTTNPLGTMCPKKELIATVTFLDDLSWAPRNAWSMGKGSSARVKGWVEWDQGMADVYFAANGGINGQLAAEGLFKDCVNLYEVRFNGAFHLETATDLDNMFYNCERLEYMDTNTLNTSSATTMYQMFRNCYALEELDVSSFNTAKVKNMSCMFSTCYSLTELDLSNFDTSSLTNMSYMFSACRGLEEVDVSSFNTSRVTNMEGVFRWCYMLCEPDLSGWNISRVRNHRGFMDEGMTIGGEPWEYFFN